MRTSKRGLRFIGRFEGLSLTPYNDPAGYCTVGYGHLIGYRRCTDHDRLLWTLKDADDALALLRTDTEARDRALTRAVNPRTTQRQFDALSSLQFNIGSLVGRTILKLHNRRPGSWQAGAAFMLYVWAGGRKLPGLVRRRIAERRLYRKGLYS